jgi:hypothetical protein
MRAADDNKRKKFVWRNSNKSLDFFFTDGYAYKCVEENIIAANTALKTNNIDYKYSREGWKALLIHYATALLNMYWEYLNDLAYIVNQSTIFECECLENVHTHVEDHQVIYDIDWSDKQILRTFINIANNIQWAMKNIFNVDTNTSEEYDDGDDKQEDYTSIEDSLEESIRW